MLRTESATTTFLALHELVDEQARLRPDAPAVRHRETVLSYRTLIERANAVANVLLAAGVRPESLVGLCVERSPDMIVAVLGILKAGAAFVALDAAYPATRLSAMAGDANLRFLVTDSGLDDRIEHLFDARINLDQLAFSELDTRSPGLAAAPDQLAYLMYTSGSTGVPKGVMIEHRNIAHLMAWARSTFSREELAQTLVTSSLSFDVSIFEIFAPLVSGGTAVIARDVLELLWSDFKNQITLFCACSSPLTELARSRKIPSSVKTIIQAGEAFPAKLVHELRSATQAKLLNIYGPTEDTIYSTSFVIPEDLQQDPPIGRPLIGKRAYVLDDDMRPAPDGTPGELYLAGPGIARGYINRTELSAERFLPDIEDPRERMYRSGDLAMRGTDGELRFLGRRDTQLKINGYRIEPGEIEAAAQRHPAVAQAVAMTVETAGIKQLALFVLRIPDATVAAAELRTVLRDQLPEYMVPAHITFVAAMPLGPTGKLDRNALALLTRVRAAEAPAPQPAHNPMEKETTERFARLLELPYVGIDENFFTLGGTSLTATRLLTEICDDADIFPALARAFAKKPTVRTVLIFVTRLRMAAGR